MKNIFKSKAFPAAALSAACIGVLAISLLVGRDKKETFQPDAPAPAAPTREWKEPPAPTAANKQPDASVPASASRPSAACAAPQSSASEYSLEQYPKAAEETEQLVTIDFTPDPEKLQPEPPETPVAEGDTSDPEQPPSYTQETLEPEPVPAQPDTPAAGATNENGAVYDPVFGWVIPSQVSQTTMDSAGDPDKMVGNM